MIPALIPARGGSKGIPRKNVRMVGGVPLIVHSIRHAQESRHVDDVVVTTDDDEIAAVAAVYGASVVRRPPELASDESPTEPALRHALDSVRARSGADVEMVVFLQATSPLRRPGDVDSAIELVREERADSLFSACRQHGFVWRTGEEGPESVTYDYRERRRRQDLDGDDWEENGSFYVFRPWVLDELDNRLGGRIAIWPMNYLDSFQIDEPGDLEIADRLVELRPAPSAPPTGLDRVRLLVLDFDGVLTDNRVLVSEEGTESVVCHRGDGWGIARVQEQGVPVVILSTERNSVVPARARKLGVECVHGCSDKESAIADIARRHGVGLEEVAFVGNDVNDAAALRLVGVPIAVRDAHPEVAAVAIAVTSRDGGTGAVREVCDWIIAAHER